MITVSKIKPGDVLYVVETYGMGNTKMRAQSARRLTIESVHPDGSERSPWPHAVLSTGRIITELQLARCRRSPPEWLNQGMFSRVCAMCHAKESDGHRPGCKHPRAVRARKEVT